MINPFLKIGSKGPEKAIYGTLCILVKSDLAHKPIFLGYFCKGIKICHISSEIIYCQLLLTFVDFYLVTLGEKKICFG